MSCIKHNKVLCKVGKMNVQFKKGVLEMCVLALLHQRNFYGYELVKEISKKISISEGTIYPLLKRLKDDGYVTTYLEESQEGAPRKYYIVTEEGRDKGQQLRNEWFEFVKQVNGFMEEVKHG